MKEREQIKARFGGLCAYCGRELGSRFHVDHVHARYRGGDEQLANKVPACQRCNLWKKTFTVEEFRREISLQIERLADHSAQYRLAFDFGIIQPTGKPVEFHFERYAAAPTAQEPKHE